MCPDKCPDLSKHSSFMAEELQKNPGIYDRLKTKKTTMGVTLAKCMKTGVRSFPGNLASLVNAHPALLSVLIRITSVNNITEAISVLSVFGP